MRQRPPRSTRTDTPVPSTTLFRSVLAPGDESTVTLDLTNFTGKAGDFKVRVDGIGPVSIGDNVRDAKIDVEAKSTLSFPITAKEGYSTANVRVRVEGNGFKVDRRYDLPVRPAWRSEEHTSELQSLMRNSYAVFCL